MALVGDCLPQAAAQGWAGSEEAAEFLQELLATPLSRICERRAGWRGEEGRGASG